MVESIPFPTINEESTRAFSAWSSRRFLLTWLAASVVVVGGLAGINCVLDIFGLFRSVEGRSLPVYHNERASKYLLSYRYIPQNFKTIILGTSLSDNLDVGPFNEHRPDQKIYNASIMGGSITEVKAIANTAIDGGVRNVIFCISPYQLKESGFKETELNKKLYYSAVGSKNLYETYAVALIRKSQLLAHDFPVKHITDYGTNFFTERYRVKDVPAKIHEVATALKGKKLEIDPAALADLRELIDTFRSKEINLLVYFHPVPAEIYENGAREHAAFQQMVTRQLDGYGTLVDFNSAQYQWFTKDYTNYVDNGHLSEKGQAYVTAELLKRFVPK